MIHQNLQTFVVQRLFAKMAFCFLSFSEAAKFSRCFLYAVTISFAVTASERI